MTMWKDMTDCEKGALLLAHRNGEQLQFKSTYTVDWFPCLSPDWDDDHEYRVKPAEPVYRRTTQDQWVVVPNMQWPLIRNCESTEHPSYKGKLAQIYKDDVLIGFTWRSYDA